MATYKLGKDCKAYYNTTAVTASSDSAYQAVNTELTNIKDLSLNLSTGSADITTRANNGWTATAATLKDGSVQFEMLWIPSDAGFTAIQDAWADSDEIALVILDGAITAGSGSQGLAGNFTVTDFSRNESLTEAVTASVTLKPSSYNTWWDVPSS